MRVSPSDMMFRFRYFADIGNPLPIVVDGLAGSRWVLEDSCCIPEGEPLQSCFLSQVAKSATSSIARGFEQRREGRGKGVSRGGARSATTQDRSASLGVRIQTRTPSPSISFLFSRGKCNHRQIMERNRECLAYSICFGPRYDLFLNISNTCVSYEVFVFT